MWAGKPVLDSLGFGGTGGAAGLRSLISPTRLNSDTAWPIDGFKGLGVKSSASRSSSNLWPRSDMSDGWRLVPRSSLLADVGELTSE